MAYTAPHSFAAGAIIDGSNIQANIDKLRDYVNGGMATADIQNASWIETKHLMRGEFIGISNSYEMRSGLSMGNIGVNESSGIGGRLIGQEEGGNPAIPGSGFSYFLDDISDVWITVTAFPRMYDGDAAATITTNSTGIYMVDANSTTTYPYTYHTYLSEAKFGVNPRSGANNEQLPGWERRKGFRFTWALFNQAVGEHAFYMSASAGVRTLPWKFFKVQVQAFKRA